MEMTESRYKSVFRFFEEKPARMVLLRFVYYVFPALIAFCYVVLLTVLLIQKNFYDLVKALLIPFSAFAGVSIFRLALDFKRPYEKFEITPLISHGRKGRSFPSRHCASAFVISAVTFCFNIPAGLALLFISCCIAVSRVLAGVHFVRDVSVGALAGLIFGGVIFFL